MTPGIPTERERIDDLWERITTNAQKGMVDATVCLLNECEDRLGGSSEIPEDTSQYMDALEEHARRNGIDAALDFAVYLAREAIGKNTSNPRRWIAKAEKLAGEVGVDIRARVEKTEARIQPYAP